MFRVYLARLYMGVFAHVNFMKMKYLLNFRLCLCYKLDFVHIDSIIAPVISRLKKYSKMFDALRGRPQYWLIPPAAAAQTPF